MELGQLEEEIVRALLNNNVTLKEGVVGITEENGGTYVMVNRRIGTKRESVVTYKRTEQRRLRIMGKHELEEFRKLLKHPMTAPHEYEGVQLADLKRARQQDLGMLLRMLKGQGRSVVKVTVYHMPGYFDVNVPVSITRTHITENSPLIGTGRMYVIDTRAAYVKVHNSQDLNK